MADLLQVLNPEQREAVTTIDGPVLVLAGPGSGKTRVLTHRVAYLVQEASIHPQNILAVTFTNKAAREMQERVQSLLNERAETLSVGTFHSLCARILRRHIDHLGYDNNYVIYDTDDQRRLVRQIIKDQMNLNEKTYRPVAIHSAISQAKNDLIDPRAYQQQAKTYWEEIAGRVYKNYQEQMQEANALDFDDLLVLAVQLFQTEPELLKRYRNRWHFLHIDEFQDTNLAQYELVQLLGAEHRNVFVVGDIDQSIYAWRGADYRNLLRFEEDFPQAKTVHLERNYRSTQTILDVAESVIARNSNRKPKQLWTDKGDGPKVVIHEAYNEVEEAQFVVREIGRLIRRTDVDRSEIAVMYRTNAQSRPIEEAFIRAKVPYTLVGGTRFYERREIKDLLAYLRLIHNPYDIISLERIINTPSRGIGSKTLADYMAWAEDLNVPPYTALQVLARTVRERDEANDSDDDDSPFRPDVPPPFSTRAENVLLDFYRLLQELIRARKEQNVVELLDTVIEKAEYEEYIRDGTDEGEDRWENIQELRNVAADYSYLPIDEGLTQFLEEVALISDADQVDTARDTVTLMTLHTAKGLEFKVVFMVGMEEGLFPHSRSMDDRESLAEERRLAYVGITRAKERLYLVHTFRRQQWGRTEMAEPSRFLNDVPSKLVKTVKTKEARQGTLNLDAGRSLHSSRGSRRKTRSKSHIWNSRDDDLRKERERRKQRTKQQKAECEFSAGDRVQHAKFGEGVVVSSKISGDDEEVTVAFVEDEPRRLLASFANLEKLS